MERNRTERNGTERNETGQNGTEGIETARNGTGRNGTGRTGTELVKSAPHCIGSGEPHHHHHHHRLMQCRWRRRFCRIPVGSEILASRLRSRPADGPGRQSAGCRRSAGSGPRSGPVRAGPVCCAELCGRESAALRSVSGRGGGLSGPGPHNRLSSTPGTPTARKTTNPLGD